MKRCPMFICGGQRFPSTSGTSVLAYTQPSKATGLVGLLSDHKPEPILVKSRWGKSNRQRPLNLQKAGNDSDDDRLDGEAMDDHTVHMSGDAADNVSSAQRNHPDTTGEVRDIREAMRRQLLFFDGGTGSLLQKQGLGPGERSEIWNIQRPEAIIGVHYDYYLAGANIITTNTFGANVPGYPMRVPAVSDSAITIESVVKAGVACALEARRRIEQEPLPLVMDAKSSASPCMAKGVSSASRPHFIALGLAPTGKLIEPLGELGFEEVVELYAQVVRAGHDGVDAILIETMGDSYETKAAVMAAKENASLPIFVTNVYNEAGRLLTGADARAMTSLLDGLGVDAYGMNCGLGPLQMEQIAPTLLSVASKPVIFNPNAGLPHTENGAVCYDIDPDEFAASVARLVEAGANLVGGCCGTTPEYICNLVNLCQERCPTPVVDKAVSLISSGTHAVQLGGEVVRTPPTVGEPGVVLPAAADSATGDAEPVIIGGRIDPVGNPEVAQALRDGDIDTLVDEALDQKDEDVDVLVVNVGLSGINEPEMMIEALEAIREVCDLPLQIETSDLRTLEVALRVCNGKPLVRFDGGNCDVLDTVFPLVHRYGGTVVVTPGGHDVSGVVTGDDAFAQRVYAEAASFGVARKDVVIDSRYGTIAVDRGDHPYLNPGPRSRAK